jgi:hypothetical protein
VYQAGGVTWIDGSAGRPPLALDVGATAVVASPGGTSLLFGGSAQHAGTWRVDLP